MSDLQTRLDFATAIAREAGAYALSRFREIDSLVIESKGHQDLVSDADKNTETLIRKAIAERFADDGVVGEEVEDLLALRLVAVPGVLAVSLRAVVPGDR